MSEEGSFRLRLFDYRILKATESRHIGRESNRESRFKVRSIDISNIIVFNINLKLSLSRFYGMTKMNKNPFKVSN